VFWKGCTYFGDDDQNDPYWFPCDLSKINTKSGKKTENVTYIFQNIFFCVHQKKEIHTHLKQFEGVFDDIIFILK